MRTPRELLLDIQEQIEHIERFTKPGREAFLSNEETQYAVMLAYVIIGEALKNVPDELLSHATQMDWRKPKAFRDYLVHNYHRVYAERVWEAVEDIPALLAAVKTLLEAAADDSS